MDIVAKIVLAIIQGITELLPVSSSAHLMILGDLFSVEIDLHLLGFLHLTTGFAILIGFGKEIMSVFKSEKRFSILKTLGMGIFPGVLIGFTFFSQIENYLHNFMPIILFNLFFWGIGMILVEKFYFEESLNSTKGFEDLKPKHALFIGLSQILALVPGTSRSGITIMSGIMLGLERKSAITFSFLIGLPLIIGACFFEILRDFNSFSNILTMQNILAGIFAFLFALLAIQILKKIAHLKFLTIFGIYRIVLAVSLAIVLFT